MLEWLKDGQELVRGYAQAGVLDANHDRRDLALIGARQRRAQKHVSSRRVFDGVRQKVYDDLLQEMCRALELHWHDADVSSDVEEQLRLLARHVPHQQHTFVEKLDEIKGIGREPELARS